MRIATFNIENLDNTGDSFEARKQILVPQLNRLNADIICFQEVHNADNSQHLQTVIDILAGTKYQNYYISFTKHKAKPLRFRNLVTASKYETVATRQYLNDFVSRPQYRLLTAKPEDKETTELTWERPILHTTVQLPNGLPLHIINVHLKSKNPTNITGQKVNRYTWASPSGWAEGSFISTIKRVGQAVEIRNLVDSIFAEDELANIVVCGDFNADVYDVATEAITGRTENTGNEKLSIRSLIPCETSVPEPSRFSLYHHGQKYMLDHILASRNLMQFYTHTEVHNEDLHDESVAFATDVKFPQSDHAPVVAEFLI